MLAASCSGHEDVRRLDVPVDEPRRMRGVESLGDLRNQVQRPRRLEPVLASEQLAQVRAFDVGHGQIESTVLLPEGQRRDDVRMVEARGDPRLPQKPLSEALVLVNSGTRSFSATRRPAFVSSAR